MSDYSWNSGTSGNWSNAADWQGGGVPNSSTADVAIAAAGSYTVTIGVGAAFTVGTLTLDDAGATLLVAGALDLAGTLTLTAGALDLNGVIAGGTIADPNDEFVASGGTLAGVTYEGTLDLGQNLDTLDFQDGLVVTGADGTGNGTIHDTGADAELLATNSGTLDKVTIDLGNGFAAATLGALDTTGAGVVLTLGLGAVVLQTGTEAILSAGSYSGDGIVNDGTIDADQAGGRFTIEARDFTNQGRFTLSHGDTLDLIATTLVNGGSIIVGGGALILDVSNFTSTGTVRIASGSTIDIQGELTLAGLSEIDAAPGTFTLDGTLALGGGTLDVGKGTALGTITFGGTIQGGVIDDAAGGIDAVGGTLDGVTLQGTLSLATNGAVLNIVDGLSGIGGAAGGTIQMGLPGYDDSTTLDLQNTETLNNLMLDVVGSGAVVDADAASGAAVVVTLGSAMVFDIGSDITWMGVDSGDKLFNQGTIDIAGGNLLIDDQYFTNAGEVTVGGTLTIGVAGSFTDFVNTGTIAIDDGADLAIDTKHLHDSGKIILEAGSTIEFGQSITTAQALAFQPSLATLRVDATLYNAGAVIAVGTGGSVGSLSVYGTIEGGIVSAPGGGVGFSGTAAGLEGVVYEGPIDLYNADTTLSISGGLTVTGAGGTGPGIVNVTAADANVYVTDTETLDDVTIDIGGEYGDFIGLEDIARIGLTLTLGPDAVLNLVGSNTRATATLGSLRRVVGDSIVNEGEITAIFYGDNPRYYAGTLTIDPTNFSNPGTIDVDNRDTLVLKPVNFTNLAGGVLTGGTYEVGAGTIELAASAEIGIDDATIVLSNVDAVIESGTGRGAVTIDRSLTAIGTSGVLQVLGDRDFTGNSAFANAGSVVLGGGIFTESNLVNAAGATIAGFGIIASTIDNSGTIEASGGTLALEQALTGTGSLDIATGAWLELVKSVVPTQTVTFASGDAGSNLVLSDPADFLATVSGFTSGDTIDLTGFAFSKTETLNYTADSSGTGGVLGIVDGTLSANLTLFGQYAAAGFAAVADGSGTAITYTPPSEAHPKLAAHG